MLNIRPEILPGLYHGSIDTTMGTQKSNLFYSVLRLVLKYTQKRKAGYFKVRF
jgi:hypothetical protein